MSSLASRPSWSFAFQRLAPPVRESQRMRAATLVRLRWVSVAGQIAACVFVAWGLWFPYPVVACLALIALSAALNVALTLRFRHSHRLSSRAAALVLLFDVLQPTGLMFLTGGLSNPFALFLILPAIVAAATQPATTVVGLSLVAIASATLLLFAHLPLPWIPGHTLDLPGLYLGGLWFSVVTTIVFATVYVYRVAAEARAVSDALGATELVLQREQHLSALDGLAAAAAHELGTPLATISLVAKEMGRACPPGDPMREDIDLLIAQSERCRDILRRLSSLPSSSEEHMAQLSLGALVDEAVSPHQGMGIVIDTAIRERQGEEPILRRNAGISYGLGNIVENAVDFAGRRVLVETRWSAHDVRVTVLDDGPGFSPESLARIGDPYLSRRERPTRSSGGGLGLGLFIAKTLLERSGATIVFSNATQGTLSGAKVEIVWPRSVLALPSIARPRAGRDEAMDGASALPAQ